MGTGAGAVAGAVVGAAIWGMNKAGWIDKAQNATMKGYDSAKKKVGQAISGAKDTVSHAIGGIGKALGFG